MQGALRTEAAPPLQAYRPGVPHERGTRVDADQQCRGLPDVLPAVDLHPEPVIHQQIPEKLLALQRRLVGTAEIPLAGPLGDPAAHTAVLPVAFVFHRGARLFGLILCLLAHPSGPVISNTHGGPSTPTGSSRPERPCTELVAVPSAQPGRRQVLRLCFLIASTSCDLSIADRPEISSLRAMSSRCFLLALASTPSADGIGLCRPPRSARASEGPLFLGQPAIADLFEAALERCIGDAMGALLTAVLIGGGVMRLGERPLRLGVRRCTVPGNSSDFGVPPFVVFGIGDLSTRTVAAGQPKGGIG